MELRDYCDGVTMLLKKADIPKEVRAKFEELGRPTIQIKYNYVAEVKRLDDQDKKDEPLGSGVTAFGREMREWLAEQASRDACWRNAGVIFAVIFGLFGIAFGLRHW
jgi:hypothetical protein